MTVVSMTKAQVIKAIKEETRLATGVFMSFPNSFFDHHYTSEVKLSDVQGNKSCSVCAVGAVMRRALSPETLIHTAREVTEAEGYRRGDTAFAFSNVADTEEDLFSKAANIVLDGCHMHALSLVFESFVEGDPEGTRKSIAMKRGRAIRFVRKYFPESISLDIHDAKPARGIKVVRQKRQR